MHDESLAGIFMTSANGLLVERHWDGRAWHWRTFDAPKPGVKILSAPGGCINDRSIFVVGSDGEAWEFYKESTPSNGFPVWIWVPHGSPSSIKQTHRMVPTRATAMNNKCLFFRVADGSLVERRWTGDKWKWLDARFMLT